MSYRTSEAREEARAALARRLSRVRDSRDRVARHAEEAEIFKELAALDLPRRTHRLPSLPLLPRVRIASPCREPWDAMEGDMRARHCSRCERDVYDVSQLTGVEVENLLRGHMALPDGGLPCLRLYRRMDGTVMTADCPTATPIKHAAQAAALAATAAGLFASWPRGATAPPRVAPRAEQIEEVPREGSVHVDPTWGANQRFVEQPMVMAGAMGWADPTRRVTRMEALEALVPEHEETPFWVRPGAHPPWAPIGHLVGGSAVFLADDDALR